MSRTSRKTFRRLGFLLPALLAIGLLAALHTHPVRLWLAKAIDGSPVAEYRFGTIEPLTDGVKILGPIDPASSAYIHLTLSMEVSESATGHPNVFQTGPGNSGVRLEISGSTAGIVYRDSESPIDVSGVVLTNSLLPNTPYQIDVEVLNGAFVRATIGQLTAGKTSSKLLVDTSDIRIGSGFGSERIFDGRLSNISMTMGYASAPAYNNLKFWMPVGDLAIVFLIIVAVLVLNRGLFDRCMLSISNAQKRWRLFGGPWKVALFGFDKNTAPEFDRSADGLESDPELASNAAASPPSSKSLYETTARALPILCSFANIALYYLVYFNRYAPITEGWFVAYAKLIESGQAPYRDFPFLLPPLYLFQTYVFHLLFGDSFLLFRLTGLVVLLGMVYLIQDLLRVFFDKWIANVAATVAVIYYQSGVAFLGYDFTQFLTLYLLLGFWCLMKAWLSRSDAGSYSYLFAAGASLAFAILTKHSNGGVAAAVALAASCAVTVKFNHLGIATRKIATLATGVLVPFTITAVALARNGSLVPFFANTGSDALQAKGGLSIVLFAWIKELLRNHYFANSIQNAASILFFSGFILSLSLAAVFWLIFSEPGLAQRISASRADRPDRKAGDARLFPYRPQMPVPVAGFIFTAMLAIAGVILLYVSGNTRYIQPILNLGGELRPYILLSSVNLYGIGFVVSGLGFMWWGRRPAASWFLLFSFGLGLIFANGTSSATLSEISLFIGVAIWISIYLTLGSSHWISMLPTLILMMGLVSFFVSAKVQAPYYWWHVQTAKANETVCTPAPAWINGLCFDPGQLKKMTLISEAIKTHSQPNDPVYVFPHLPIFNLLTDRPPYRNAVVSWYDFMSDREAEMVAASLAADPPSVIVFAKLPPDVADIHERIFRNGRPLGQRKIIEAVDDLLKRRVFSKILAVQDLNRVDVEVYARTN
jgi:hypothetical protein